MFGYFGKEHMLIIHIFTRSYLVLDIFHPPFMQFENFGNLVKSFLLYVKPFFGKVHVYTC